METSLTAENMGGFEARGLMESYCIFSFIYLANIYSGPGTRSLAVNKKTSPQQSTPHTRAHTHTHMHTQRKYIYLECLRQSFSLYWLFYTNSDITIYYDENGN